MSRFEWTEKRSVAAVLLADGYTIEEIAAKVKVSEKTIDRWKRDTEFSEEVDRLSLMVGMASRAERLRLAKRIIRTKSESTKKDLLEWVKFAQSETDGARIDLAAFAEAATSMADGQQDGMAESEAGDASSTSEAA